MSQPVIAEERVNLPQGRNMSAPGAQPQRAAEPARMSREPQPPARSNPRERDRVATPLEMAVEGELNRAPSEPPTAQFGSQSGSQSGSKGAKQSPASMGALAPDAPLGMDDLQASYSVEAEPIRELTRPIAQTVSKHAPEVDATFGAMLRRSLSLRPR